MHAPTLLHYWLDPWLQCIHAKRLAARCDMVAGCMAGAGLSVTLGRCDDPEAQDHLIINMPQSFSGGDAAWAVSAPPPSQGAEAWRPGQIGD